MGATPRNIPGMDLTDDDRRRVGALAHELNNHLTAARLTAELCERKVDDRARVERGFRQIRELTEHAIRVADELLALSRGAPAS
jgi:signal transduction histidine kinase